MVRLHTAKLVSAAVVAAVALGSTSQDLEGGIHAGTTVRGGLILSDEEIAARAGGGGQLGRLRSALTLSDDEIEASADQACAYMDEQHGILPDTDPYAVRLETLTRGLEQEDSLSLDFGVYKADEVNAWAMPNGCIRVYSGLLDIASDEEVLGVIGHEIGHVKLGHTKARMRSALLARAGREAAAAGGGTGGALAASEVGGLVETVLNAQFSQRDERAADDYGYEFMVRHGHDPNAMVTLFEKLPGKGGLVSSHPPSEQRADRIRKRIAD